MIYDLIGEFAACIYRLTDALTNVLMFDNCVYQQ